MTTELRGTPPRSCWTPPEEGPRPLSDRLIAPIIRQVDHFLRGRQGIFEYNDDERCVFRLSVHPFGSAHRWPDGTTINRETVVGELHLWNEHFAGFSVVGCGGDLRSLFFYSFRALAQTVAANSRLRSLPGFYAESWVPAGHGFGSPGVARSFVRWGFQIDEESDKTEFWEQLYVRLLTRTFNPGAPRGPLRRVRIWISRDELFRRFGDNPTLQRRASRKPPVRETPDEIQRRLTAGG